jgi:hypothetical protein
LGNKITRGLVTALTAFVHTTRQFYAARLLVGVAEASFFPGIIVYLTHWFRLKDRAKALRCSQKSPDLSHQNRRDKYGVLLTLQVVLDKNLTRQPGQRPRRQGVFHEALGLFDARGIHPLAFDLQL